MQNFLDAVCFHLARYAVDLAVGGTLLLVGLLYTWYHNLR